MASWRLPCLASSRRTPPHGPHRPPPSHFLRFLPVVLLPCVLFNEFSIDSPLDHRFVMSRSERSSIVTNRGTKKSGAVPSTRTSHSNEITTHRSKSRSPSRSGSGSRSDPFTLAPPTNTTVKRKRSSASVGTSTTPAIADDFDRGQRIKSKPSVTATRALLVPSGSSSSHRPKKERERSRHQPEHSQWLQSPNLFPPSDGEALSIARRGIDKGKARQVMEIGPAAASYSGPLAAAEYERMRKELETLKKTVHESKKQLKKQNKVRYPSFPSISVPHLRLADDRGTQCSGGC